MKNQNIEGRQLPARALVVKIANAEDEATGDAAEIFGFRKVRNRRGRIRVNRNDARKSEKLIELLLNKNLDQSGGDVDQAVEAAIASDPVGYIVNAKHVGWRADRKRFVRTKDVIGKKTKHVRIEPPIWLTERQKSIICEKGNLDQWIELVAIPAKYSTRLMLVLSTACAAPLAGLMSMQPFGLNLFGRSKVGKTAALLAGTSFIGIGSESSLPNWNMTDAAFQELARVFNDQIFGVNEVGLLPGKKSDAYSHHIRANIYRFSEGKDRSRHTSSGVGSSAASSTWNGIFFSTAEHSFNAYASFSGETREEGEIARCLDIPATEQGRPTIFDKWPKSVGKEGADTWAKAKVIKLRKACEANCGVAFEPYIEHLIRERENLQESVQEWINEFVGSVRAPEHNGALQHAVKNVGLIYAGGRAGIAAGILPWKPKKLLAAIQKCFKAALRELRIQEDAERNIRKVLREKLGSSSVALLSTDPSFSSKALAGYYEEKQGKTVYTIQSKAFKDWFPVHAHQVAALQWLVDSGKLQQSSRRAVSNTFTVGTKTNTLEQQRRWPDRSNPRCFVFADPFEQDL